MNQIIIFLDKTLKLRSLKQQTLSKMEII